MARSNFITGLDIGSSSVKGLLASKKEDSQDFEVLCQHSEPCFGIVRRGVVINIEEVSEKIKLVLAKMEKSGDREIKDVFINVGGSHVFSTSSHGTVVVSRADQEISREDIDRVLEAAQAFSLPLNREVMEVLPKEFIVDGKEGVKQPLGMKGLRLEAETLVLCAFSPYLRNLTQAVGEAGVDISGCIISPLASAKAVLAPREKELGVLLLDIGSRTTGFALFKESDLIHTAIIPIGSGHITDDIGIGLKTDPDTAERIKLEFGSCALKGRKKRKVKEDTSGETLVFSENVLGKIINSRVSEIFEQVQREAKKAAPKEIFPAGVVITGGGAKMPGMKDLAKKILKLPSRIGLPQGFFPEQEDPGLSVACGLVLYGFEIGGGIGEKEKKSRIWSKIKKFLNFFVP